MKKLLAILLLTLTATAQAGGGHHHGGYYRTNSWVAPALIGGIVGYGLARPYYPPVYTAPPVVYAPPPVYYPQPPVYYQQPVQPQSCQRVIIQNEQGQFIREETRCN